MDIDTCEICSSLPEINARRFCITCANELLGDIENFDPKEFDSALEALKNRKNNHVSN